MRNSLVRLSLPLLLLLAAALMLAGKSSAGPMQVAAPAQNGFTKPEVMQAGLSQNGCLRPEIRLAAPAQNGFFKPDVKLAGPMQTGFIRPTSGPGNTPLTIPYIFAASGFMEGGPVVEV